MAVIEVVLWSSVGCISGMLLACIPGLHPASTIAVIVCSQWAMGYSEVMPPLVISAAVAYSIISFVPVVLMSVPDEGLFAVRSPAQSMLERGDGLRAVLLGGLGASLGLVGVSIAYLFQGRRLLPPLLDVLGPHWHWIVWSVVLFLIMSEWPQRAALGRDYWGRMISAWRLILRGHLVFIASGLLGLCVFFGLRADSGSAFASIMPMVTGMFSVPWLVMSLVSIRPLPVQVNAPGINCDIRDIAGGALSGWLGGMFAVIIPGVTAGVGGLVAGHACSLRNKERFIVAQGCCRSVYMCGGVMLMFVPGVDSVRGSLGMMLRAVYEPFPQTELSILLGGTLLCSAACLGCLPLIARLFMHILRCGGRRVFAILGLVTILALNFYVTGLAGLGVLLVSALIGGTALLYGVRRMNCLGCILMPVGVALSGWEEFLF